MSEKRKCWIVRKLYNWKLIKATKDLSRSIRNVGSDIGELSLTNSLRTIMISYTQLPKADQEYIDDVYELYNKRTDVWIGSHSIKYYNISTVDKRAVKKTKKTLELARAVIEKIDEKKDASKELKQFRSCFVALEEEVYMSVLAEWSYELGKDDGSVLCQTTSQDFKKREFTFKYKLFSKEEAEKQETDILSLDGPYPVRHYTKTSLNDFIETLREAYSSENHTLIRVDDAVDGPRTSTIICDVDPNTLKKWRRSYVAPARKEERKIRRRAAKSQSIAHNNSCSERTEEQN